MKVKEKLKPGDIVEFIKSTGRNNRGTVLLNVNDAVTIGWEGSAGVVTYGYGRPEWEYIRL